MAAYLSTLTLSMADAVVDGIHESSSPGSGAITLNGSLVTSGVAYMDIARRIIFTSGSDDSSITFSIVGTDRYGRPQSETLAGVDGAAATSVKDYLTVTSITHSGSVAGTLEVGTSQVASTAPLVIDTYSNHPYIGATLTGTGTWNASLEVANDDLTPNFDVNNNPPTYTAPSAFSGKSTTTQGQITGPVTLLRLTSATFTNPAVMIAKLNLPFGVGAF